MNRRPPLPPQDALSAEEREIATHLAKLDASAAPSAALDARVLAMARGGAVPGRGQVRRWPGVFGAAAVLVAAAGLAWQLKPMFSLGPPPIRSDGSGAGRSGVESDVVVAVESVPRRAPEPVAEAGDAAAQALPPAAVRRAAPVVGASTMPNAPAPAATHSKAAAPAPEEFVEERLQAVPRSAAPAAAAQDAAAPPPAAAAEGGALAVDDVVVTGSRIANTAAAEASAPDVTADTRLGARAWLARIRDRRDNGDVAGARASLARFVARHPRVDVPPDLRPLLPERDPWAP